MINNLSQLKKAISNGNIFEVVKHYVRPEFEGQIRKPNIIQTNGFYSIEKDKPDSVVTLANNCKGSWSEYGKAGDWKFEDGLCKQFYMGKPIWEIRILS